MNHDLSQTSIQRRRRKITQRERVWLTGLAVFMLVALIAWRPLRHELMLSLALRSDGPSESVLAELADDGRDRAKTLERMWRSGNLTARVFVLDYLKTRLHAEPVLVSQMETIVKEAACDPDLTVREPALNILAEDKNPGALALIRGQLTDADPAVRVLGLQQLHQAATSNDVPAVIHLLNDSDPRVVVSAAVLLRRITALDFGIRTSDALPNFTRSDGEPPATFNLAAIQRGVAQWHEWWALHHAEFPEPAKLPRTTVPAMPVKDFALEDLNGRQVHLSDFRGKVVLLCFWKMGESASFDDLSVLKQLQEQNPQRLAVLGVAFNPSVGPQDDCGEGEGSEPGHEHHHDHAHMMNMTNSSMNAMSVHCVVSDLIEQKGIHFPVALDKKGDVVFRFNVQDMPTYALIDAQGNLHRRFTGSREFPAWTAMLAEVSIVKLSVNANPFHDTANE